MQKITNSYFVKLIIVCAVFLITILVTNNLIWFFSYSKEVSNHTDSVLKSRVEDAAKLIQSNSDTAVKTHLQSIATKDLEIVNMFYEQYKRGEITEDAAKKIY